MASTQQDTKSSTTTRKRKSDDDNINDKNNNTTMTTKSIQEDCPYLDTIQRSLLDFDFEPSCSVSLESGPHVYGCLVCGKYFRGRGRNTPAYTHSVEEDHFVFIHLTNSKFYCLPDNYEIHDSSLQDISAALHPTFTEHEIQSIDQNTQLVRDLFGRRYLPGYVGLNNAGKTDYINVVVQALAHIRPLRDYFLRLSYNDTMIPVMNKKRTRNSKNGQQPQQPQYHRMSALVLTFGELIRKLWSDKRYKSTVDPHMLVQTIYAQNKKYHIGQQVEIGDFFSWFLNQLHIGLGGTRKSNSSIINKLFQGHVEVITTTTTNNQKQRIEGADGTAQTSADSTEQPKDDSNDTNKEATSIDVDSEEGKADKDVKSRQQQNMNDESIVTGTGFLMLTLDIPEKPLFRDDDGGLVIPQEPLANIMKKFDGITFSEILNRNGQVERKKYRITELPPYLILHLARFKTNNYSREKNPTIVAFPVKNLDLSSYVFPKNGGKEKLPTEKDVRTMNVKDIQALLKKYGRADIAEHSVEKKDLVEATVDFVCKSLPDLLADKYDLIANITHDNPADVGREGKSDPLQEGSYKAHVHHKINNQWYEIQDLHVQETMPQLIGVSESYLLVFERKSAQQIDLSK